MTKFSPAAQAVLDAYRNADIKDETSVAAVLHTAASQLLAVQWNGQIPVSATEQIGINWARDALHVLANELEAL